MNEKEIKQYESKMHGQYTYMKTLSLRSNAFYSFLLLAIIVCFALLPFIYVQVYSTASVSIQPLQHKETIYAPVAGKITQWGIANNRPIKKGDTICQFSQEFLAQLGAVNPLAQNPRSNNAVVANISGTGYITEGLQVGSNIQGGQKIAEIIPDSGLLAVCYVSPKDIAYVKPGQKVQLQVDAYNYYEWGMVNASVTEVLNDLVTSEHGSFYMVYCKLGSEHLQQRNGNRGKLLKGMTGKANFLQNKKSLWQLLFTKVNEWFNPKAS
jgi:multidrug resistance efflux pump